MSAPRTSQPRTAAEPTATAEGAIRVGVSTCLLGEQVRHAIDDDPRLARAGASQNEQRTFGVNDRVSLRAVLPGDGSRRPFMLLNHMDVVPVQREYWDEEPFAGIVKDGFIDVWDRPGLGVTFRVDAAKARLHASDRGFFD